MATTTDCTRLAPRAARTLAGALIASAMLIGCASLDTQPDRQRASSLIHERSGFSPDWETQWNEVHREWDGQSPLTAETAVRLALVKNRSIRASVERLAASRADFVQAGLLPNPILSVGLGFSVGDSSGATSISAGLTQQLVALWLRDDRMKEAAAELEGEILSLSDTTLRIIAEVRHMHAELVWMQRELALLGEHQSLIETHVRIIGQQVDAGIASSLDLTRIELALHALINERMQQEHAFRVARLAMLEKLGHAESAADFTLHDRSTGEIHSLALQGEDAIVEHALANRLDLAAASARVIAARQSLRLEERSRFPANLEAGAAYSRDENRRQELGPAISLEVPLFDSGDARTARAAALWRASEIEADAVRQRAILESRSAWSEWTRAHALLARHDHDVLPRANRQLELAQTLLDAGEVDMTVLLEAQREAIAAARVRNRLQADVIRSAITLDYATSTFVGSSPTAQNPDDTE